MADEPSIISAIQQIADEKGIRVEAIVAAIEAALAAAYRKDFGEKNQNIRVTFRPETGAAEVFDVKTVVDDALVEAARARAAADETRVGDGGLPAVPAPAAPEGPEAEAEPQFNPKTDVGLAEARTVKPDAEVGEEIRTPLAVPTSYGRMAAQTAKQVIIQKLREAEHANVYEQFKGREHQLLNGVVQRRDPRAVYVELGRGTGLMPPEEQLPRERYAPGDRIKVYLVAVNTTPKGPEIIVSRSHPEVVRQVFSMEIPEIMNGLIAIRGIAREAGSRSKVAVEALDSNVDPIGSCVGQRGTRVQTIIGELGGEKVDIIDYNADPVRYISNALSPAKVLTLEVNEALRTAVATVAEDQLSLAIGKGGQNVRLAAKLTGWKIDIRSEGGTIAPVEEAAEPADAPSEPAADGSPPPEASPGDGVAEAPPPDVA